MRLWDRAASKRDNVSSPLPAEVEAALRQHAPVGERIVWVGRPSVAHAVERKVRSRWQTATILGGGYSLLLGVAAAWLTGHIAWIALPLAWLTVCGCGLGVEWRHRERWVDALVHTAYAVTLYHALAVRTKPALQTCIVALADVEPRIDAGSGSDVADLVFARGDGSAGLEFVELPGAAPLKELVEKLKAAPEVMEQQYALLAQWAEIRKQAGG
jgi:hypothetical protein